MCRWHKHAVKIAATDPVTGEFNVGFYAVGLTAMALFRIEQDRFKMPKLFSIDGFNPSEILTKEALDAYECSGLKRPLTEAQPVIDEMAKKIRQALVDTNRAFGLSKENLSLPDIVTKDGYKKTCCADPDPRENGPFLDAAVVYLFKGYDDANRSFASKHLQLISAKELESLKNDSSIPKEVRQYMPMLEPIRLATEIFLSQSGVVKALDDAFVASIAYIFETAEDDLKHKRGINAPSNCIMCEGHKGRKPQPS